MSVGATVEPFAACSFNVPVSDSPAEFAASAEDGVKVGCLVLAIDAVSAMWLGFVVLVRATLLSASDLAGGCFALAFGMDSGAGATAGAGAGGVGAGTANGGVGAGTANGGVGAAIAGDGTETGGAVAVVLDCIGALAHEASPIAAISTKMRALFCDAG